MVEKVCSYCAPLIYLYPIDQMECDVCGRELANVRFMLDFLQVASAARRAIDKLKEEK